MKAYPKVRSIVFFKTKKALCGLEPRKGLNRYDGYKFKTYKHDPQDPTTISDDYVWALYEDKYGAIWIGTYYGLNKFNRKEGIFVRFFQDRDDVHSLSHNDVRTICEDRSGMLWIGTYGGGLNKFDRTTGKFIHYKHDPSNQKSLSHNEVTSIFIDHMGVLWVGTKEGLNRFNRKTSTFERFKHNQEGLKSLNHNEVTSIYEDSLKVLWVGTKDGLNTFNRDTGAFKSYKHNENNTHSLSHSDVTSIYEDSEKVLWIGTRGGGVNIFDRNSGNFTHYLHDEANVHSLNSNRVLSIYEDLSGALWFGTRTGGVNTVDRRSRNFALYQHNAANLKSLSDNDVRSIYEDKSGVLWIGTLGSGLNAFDRKSGGFTHYKHDLSNPYSLSHNDIRVIYEDNSGFLWIGTGGGGLNRFDRKTKSFVHYKNNTNNLNTLSYNDVKAIHEDKRGMLWIGTLGGGLNSFDRERDIFTRYTYDKNNPYSLSDRVRCIYEDRSGVLWIGTDGGLNRFDRNINRFKRYQHHENDDKSLSHNRVRYIHEDQSGVLWIGTRGGLNKFIDREQGYFLAFREEDGLPNNIICGILEDTRGNFWISTNNGLSKFNPKTKFFKNYFFDDGLQSNEFNSGAYFKNKIGEMFFGGINGFNSFFPEQIKDNPFAPPVVITDLLFFNKSVQLRRVEPGSSLQKAIEDTVALTLNYRQNVFSFEFAALHYANPKRNRYKYKLEGWDNDWIATDSENRRATYTNLLPGNYIFRVNGSNKDGVWNQKGTAIKLRILPPPWKTWWAYTLYALALILIFFLLWSAWSRKFLKQKIEDRTEKLKKAKEEAENANKAKDKFLANVSHEIRTPMYHIIGFTEEVLKSDLGSKQKEYLQRVRSSAHGLSRIINDILNFSKMESGEFEISHTQFQLGNILDDVISSFTAAARKKNIELHMERKKGIPDSLVGDEVRLKQVFQNLIGNAIRFTKKGEVTMTVSCIEKKQGKALIRFSIKDTGIGISREDKKRIFLPYEQLDNDSARGIGLGLAISKQLVELMGGKIWFESELKKGSTFYFSIPFDIQTNGVNLKEKVSDDMVKESDFADLKGVYALLVEDDASSRLLMEGILIQAGMRTDCAKNGHEAVQKVDQHSYDLVLMDMRLPELNGYEAIKVIRKDQRFTDLPIIAVTAHAILGDQRKCLDAGANDYISKPIDSNNLLLAIKKLIQKRGEV